MEDKPQSTLIILEGPSGTGKTTIQKALHTYLSQQGLDVEMLPEFSHSPLGQKLREESLFGVPLPPYLVELSGAFAYLSDKLYLLEEAAQASNRIFIMDRFIISQAILGSYFTAELASRQLLLNLIREIYYLIQNKFSAKSRLFILEAPPEIIAERLEKRLQRELQDTEKTFIRENREAYRQFPYSDFQWSTFFCDSVDDRQQTVQEILSHLEGVPVPLKMDD